MLRMWTKTLHSIAVAVIQPHGWQSCTKLLNPVCSQMLNAVHHMSSSGPWFNIKMSSYQYRKSHCVDKTVVRSSYLRNGISYTGKMVSLYWIGPSIIFSSLPQTFCIVQLITMHWHWGLGFDTNMFLFLLMCFKFCNYWQPHKPIDKTFNKPAFGGVSKMVSLGLLTY